VQSEEEHGVDKKHPAGNSSLHSALRTPRSAPAPVWTPTQRRSILVLCLILLMFLAVESLRKSAVVGDPPPQNASRADQIQDRLDPNTADAAALAAIPELGEKRAAEIVEYREKFLLQYPGHRAFDSADDLMRVKGFGLATVANLGPYLRFPNENAPRPSASGIAPK
jgi:competence protein ComEA